MFSMCSELTPRAPIPDRRIAQFMQPWWDYWDVRWFVIGWIWNYNDYVLKAVFSDAHSEVRSFESGNTRKRKQSAKEWCGHWPFIIMLAFSFDYYPLFCLYISTIDQHSGNRYKSAVYHHRVSTYQHSVQQWWRGCWRAKSLRKNHSYSFGRAG